ncbi:MAG: hypothetical protein C4320_05635, partial [Armatimonadota bacterium]
MNPGRFSLIAIIGLWIAAGVQAAAGQYLPQALWTPHILLAFASVLALWSSRRVGLLLGFVVGIVDATMAGDSAFFHIAARMLAGLIAASFGNALPDRGPGMGALASGVAALASNLFLLLFLAPRPLSLQLAVMVTGAIMTGLVGG